MENALPTPACPRLCLTLPLLATSSDRPWLSLALQSSGADLCLSLVLLFASAPVYDSCPSSTLLYAPALVNDSCPSSTLLNAGCFAAPLWIPACSPELLTLSLFPQPLINFFWGYAFGSTCLSVRDPWQRVATSKWKSEYFFHWHTK